MHEGAGALDEAAAQYRTALEIEPGNNDAYLGLSRIKLPGPIYYDVLRGLHEAIRPATYLEIGVAEGVSLSLAQPPTVAVVVDPAPAIRYPVSVQCHLYVETSDAFFSDRDVRKLLGGGPSLAFIDGLHQYPAVLRDFLNMEAVSDPDTVVLLHDMIPFDEVTQRPERAYNFYTGDVWKLLHCLADVRPDLSWFTVRTPPSGLTVLSGLDPNSTVLRDRYDELVARYGDLPFEADRPPPGEVVENDWSVIAGALERLRSSTSPSSARRAPVTMTPEITIEPLSDVSVPAHAPASGRAGGATPGPDPFEVERPADRGELQWRVEQLRATKKALDQAYDELTAIRQTKLFRWSRPVRRFYGTLRHRRNGT